MSNPTPTGARRVYALLLGLAVALVATEIAVRFLPLPQRTQVIRQEGVERLHESAGVPLWEGKTSAALRPDCEDRRPIHVYGSSIFRGEPLEPGEVFSERLSDDACVRNFAESALPAEGSLALARRHVPEDRPIGILWEIWGGAIGRFTMVGDSAFNLRGTSAPTGIWLALVGNFRSAEYLWLSSIERPLEHDPVGHYVDEILPEIIALAESHGATLKLVFCPPLHQPFSETLRRHDPLTAEVKTRADAAGVSWTELAAEWNDDDLEGLRWDTCCHYNAEGHRVLADTFRPWVRSLTSP